MKAEATAWYEKGVAAGKTGDAAGAIAAFNRALALKPDSAEACFALAQVLEQSASVSLAIKTYQHLLKIDPAHETGKARLTALQNLFQQMLVPFAEGTEYFERGDMENAVPAFKRALEIHPRVPDALANLGLALFNLRRFPEAEQALLEAVRLQPNHTDAMATLGSVYHQMERYDKAVAVYRQVTSQNPDYLRGWTNFGKILMKIGDDAGAAEAFENARRIDPRHAEVLGELLHRFYHLCRWEKIDEITAQLTNVLETTKQSASPFLVILHAPPSVHLENAKRYSAKHYPGPAYDAKRKLPSTDGKLRIGYLSADFHQHATAFLISELFEQHDRKKFEIVAYSSGTSDESEARKRIVLAVDAFRDIRTIDSKSAAACIRQDGIDILVDLKGHTRNQRMDVMARRPAPIQMHYLGYPGSIGAHCIDYFIADPTSAPAAAEKDFFEALVRLPHSYQINDRKRPLPENAKPREAYGLPKEGVVFCGFNRAYKITPAVFDVWMRLLAKVEGSVLWLYEEKTEAMENLRCEATKRGVDPKRIITAPTMKLAEHLARYLHADLFLDTFPVCGHTTASDALWCGVPVVTLVGESFVSRVAASLLQAVQLPELITTNWADYESLALALARDAGRRQKLRQYLENGRMNFPLFDSLATTRALEAVYLRAAELHRAGQPPQAFAVD